MDVSATGQVVAAAVPQANVEAVTGSVPAPAPQGAASSASAQVQTQTQTQTQTAAVPASGPVLGATHQRSTLAPAVAKLFSIPAPPEPIRLNVSYRVQRDPNEIVTVFSDPKTGEEVAQFPPDVLINLAQFFDQHRGVTLDQNA